MKQYLVTAVMVTQIGCEKPTEDVAQMTFAHLADEFHRVLNITVTELPQNAAPVSVLEPTRKMYDFVGWPEKGGEQ